METKHLDDLDATETTFVHAVGAIQTRLHETAVEKGWWDKPRNDAELIALMHSELSEALEGLRKDNPASDKIPPFSQIAEEFADVIIRILDMADARGIPVAEAIIAKARHNIGRPYRHGNKKF